MDDDSMRAPREALNVAVCEALGLDPAQVKRIAIYLNAGEVPVAAVEMFADSPAVAGVLKAFTIEARPASIADIEMRAFAPGEDTGNGERGS